MATKTITITEEAYNKLKIRKRGSESFSDVINRKFPFTKYSDFIGILSEESARKLEKSIEESKSDWEEGMDRITKQIMRIKD